jgi:hypothetical protein
MFVQELVPSQLAVTWTVIKQDDGIPMEFVDAQYGGSHER